MIRTLLFWTHLVMGLSVGLVIAFLALTGATLALAPQWIAFAERSARVQPQVADGRCVLPSALLRAAAADGAGQAITGIMLYADPHRPAEVALGTHGAVLLMDSCTGQVLGPGASRLRIFLADVTDLHHMVSLNGPRHQMLRAWKNGAVLLFTFLILSGLVLWWPATWTRERARRGLLPRPGLRGRARDWSLHNTAGFWLALPLLTICLTGLIMAYPWANALLFRAAGEAPPAPRRPAGEGGGSARDRARPADREHTVAHDPARPSSPASSSTGSSGRSAGGDRFEALDRPLSVARRYAPGIQSVSLRLPAPLAETVQIQLGHDAGVSPIYRDQLTLTVPDGRLVRLESPSTATRGRHWRFIVRFLHTGQIFGFVGQIVALFSALAALLLVWTGFSLALRRWLRWRQHTLRAGQDTPPARAVHAAGD